MATGKSLFSMHENITNYLLAKINSKPILEINKFPLSSSVAVLFHSTNHIKLPVRPSFRPIGTDKPPALIYRGQFMERVVWVAGHPLEWVEIGGQ